MCSVLVLFFVRRGKKISLIKVLVWVPRHDLNLDWTPELDQISIYLPQTNVSSWDLNINNLLLQKEAQALHVF